MLAPFIFSFSIFILNLLVMFYCAVSSVSYFSSGHTIIAVLGLLVAAINAYCAFEGIKNVTRIIEYWRK